MKGFRPFGIKSFVKEKLIEIDGTNCQFDKDWCWCRKCYNLIRGIENHISCKDIAGNGKSGLL